MDANYIHIRDHDEEGDLLNFGGATIAYTVQRIADGLHVRFAVAECTEEDRFVKAIGRAIAYARLEANNLYGEFEVSNQLEDELQKMIVHEYLNYKSTYFDSNINLKHFWYPHHPGYKLGPDEGFDEEKKEPEICPA